MSVSQADCTPKAKPFGVRRHDANPGRWPGLVDRGAVGANIGQTTERGHVRAVQFGHFHMRQRRKNPVAQANGLGLTSKEVCGLKCGDPSTPPSMPQSPKSRPYRPDSHLATNPGRWPGLVDQGTVGAIEATLLPILAKSQNADMSAHSDDEGSSAAL